MSGGGEPRGSAQEFKRLFERCLQDAGLSGRAFHDELLRETNLDLPENSIDSWRRPHTTTGEPSLPRPSTVAALAEWLCSRKEVRVTEEELLAAWRSDKAARAARRTAGASVPGGKREDRRSRARLARGEWFEGIVDATIYLGVDSVLGRVDQRLRDLLNSGQPIPTYYAYLTHRGYLNWVNLTEDERYTYYRAGVALCETHAGEIAEELLAATGGNELDFVSLGPGTGSKDRVLLRRLLGSVSAGGSLYYYPYDINPAMVVHAIQTVLTGEPPSPVLVKGIIAPFDSLGLFSYVYKDRDGANVLSLLGNTLGNMSDDLGFLETVFVSGMWRGDLLLLEVRCHADEGAGKAPGIGEEAKMRFNFGPMEILGADYEDHRDRITIRREQSRSAIPNTVTTVTRCGTVRCAGGTWNDVRLAYVHEYSEPDLDATISGIGYDIVRKFRPSAADVPGRSTVLLYVLAKR